MYTVETGDTRSIPGVGQILRVQHQRPAKWPTVQMQESQKIHVRKRGYLSVSPHVRLGTRRMRRELPHRILDRVADYPRRQLVVVLVDFTVELHDN